MKPLHYGIVAALFLGSTAAHGGLIAKKIYKDLDHALGFYVDPSASNRSFVLQQDGKIRTIENGLLTTSYFADLPPSVVQFHGERGLLSMAFHPQYSTNHFVYLDFVDPNGDIQIARFTSNANGDQIDLASRLNIIKIAHPVNDNHNGGTIRFGPDGYLYISTGDGGSANDPPGNSQNLEKLLGKMIRIDVDHDAFAGNRKNYAIPKGNPFKGPGKAGLGEIWAYGLRNPFRWTFDPLNGHQIIGDVGQGHYEEIDIIPAGQGGMNFGWRAREGFHDNEAVDDPAPPNATDPIFEYDHSIGQCIIGGAVYRGTALGAAYEGRYFFADYVTSRIWSIDPYAADVPSTLIEHTAELKITGAKISSFDTNQQGEMILVDSRGRIYRLDLDPGASIIDWLNERAV